MKIRSPLRGLWPQPGADSRGLNQGAAFASAPRGIYLRLQLCHGVFAVTNQIEKNILKAPGKSATIFLS